MKFFADQDVYGVTVDFLIALGHDVATAAQLGLSRTTDSQILAAAQADQRILVTRDRDFGAIVFVQGGGPGVIYLRVLPSTLNAVHAELESVLSLYTEAELMQSFVVVEPASHRIRRVGPTPPGGP